MEKRAIAQAGMNVFSCPERKCEGTGFVPVTLKELAKIRTLLTEKRAQVRFTCKHSHTVILRCGHMHTLRDRPNLRQ